MYVDLENALAFLLIMLRMAGMLVVNPIFGRSNIPTMLNAGLSLILAVLLLSSVPLALPDPDPSFPALLLMALKELSIGIIASFIMRAFTSVFVIGGEIIDMQLGIGMAKVFDPGTNASVSLTSTMLNIMYTMVFFATNNHLTYIKMAAQTFEIIPLGGVRFNWDIGWYLPEYFSTIFLFGLKLCLPIVIIEIIVTVAVGLIMRIIPQINIFVVNIQFKLVIGFVSLIVLVAPFMAYLENMIIICFEQIGIVWRMLSGA